MTVLKIPEICKLINLLPGVDELVEFAKTSDGLQEALRTIDHRLLKLLRWIILSNTAIESRGGDDRWIEQTMAPIQDDYIEPDKGSHFPATQGAIQQ